MDLDIGVETGGRVETLGWKITGTLGFALVAQLPIDTKSFDLHACMEQMSRVRHSCSPHIH